MSHNHERSDWKTEALLSLISGVIYGGTNTIVGHPFDTIKTKMQAQSDVLVQKDTLIQITKKVTSQEGVLVLYKGCVPPFIGSIMYRSLQFSVFELFFTKWEKDEHLSKKIAYSGGLEYRTVLAGVLASMSRAFLECPFEYAKVRLQTNQQWKLRELYVGFKPLLVRTTGLMTVYFIILDSLRRHTSLLDSLGGQFLASGGASVVSWGLFWPFETVKNQIQAGTTGVGFSTSERMMFIYRLHGYQGFFRGFSAGAQSVFYRNGAAMIAMQKTQQQFTQRGYRKKH